MSKKSIDNLRKRQAARLAEEENKLKSAGPLDQADTKGVGLPKHGKEGKVEDQLKSAGPLDQADTKGVGYPRQKRAVVKEMVNVASSVGKSVIPAEASGGVLDDDETEIVNKNIHADVDQKAAIAEEDDEASEKKSEEDDEEEVKEEAEKEKDEDSKDDEFSLDEEDEKSDEEKAKEDAEMKEHLDAIFAGQQLSEEFLSNARTVFEAAVAVKNKADRAKLMEQGKLKLRKMTQQLEEKLVTQMDAYHDYVISEWIEENKPALVASTKLDIVEAFIVDLKALFEKHHIDVPQEKISLVDEQRSQIEELEHRLNEEVQRGMALHNQIKALKKQQHIANLSEGLTAVDAEKLRKLAEEIAFDDDVRFVSKIKTLKESYKLGSKTKLVPAKHDALVEDTSGQAVGLKEVTQSQSGGDARMSAYVNRTKRLITRQ